VPHRLALHDLLPVTPAETTLDDAPAEALALALDVVVLPTAHPVVSQDFYF
jgi:hypothetical protein